MPIINPCALLDRLLAEPQEQPWLEFKVNDDDPQNLGEYVSALANAAMLADRERGYLVFGIQDGTKEKIGTNVRLESKKKGNENFLNWLTRLLDPKILVEVKDFECNGKYFSVLCVEPSFERPVKFSGTAYIRIGSYKKKLSDFPEYERALWLATGRRRFENTIAMSNVSTKEVFDLLDYETYYKLSAEPIPKSHDEIVRKLLSIDAIKENMEGKYDILNLGAILFAKDVSNFPSIKRKSVRVIKFSGDDKRRSEFEREGKFGYAVGFPNLIRLVMQWSSEERYVDGVRRRTPIIPEDAVREVIANALIHQDFTKDGAGPVVEIFANRIEVINPGHSLIEPDRMIDERRSRNELLAETMRGLGLCEERGGGLDKAIMALEEAYLPAPEFIPSEDSMRVVLFGPRPFKKMSKQDKQRACFFHCVIRWMQQDYMSNSSLRKRFSLDDDDYQAVSVIISEAIKAGRIAPADPKQGKKNARYVPYWAA